MKKLMLYTGKAMACLMLLCLLLAQGCKKEVHQHPATQTDNLNPGQLIKAAKLDAWFATNPVARYLSPNWAKARQAKVNDKRIVRVPLFNIDKATAIANATTAIEGKNANYNEKHPPEIFFIEDQSGRLYSFLLNFIPTDPTKENGENGIWTGKLYDWNMTGDTIHVQDIVKSRLKERFAFKAGQDSGNELLSAKLKNNKLQSLGGLKDKQVSSFFGWLKNLVENLVGFVGNLFGLSEYRGRYNEGGYWEGYRLTMMWKYLTNYDDPNTLGGNPAFAEVIYAAGGPKVYESYLSGYINNNDPEEDTNHDWNGNVSGGGSGGSDGGPSYTPYDYWPSEPPETNHIQDLINDLNIRYDAELVGFLKSANGESIAIEITKYLDAYGRSEENKEFVLLAVRYVSTNCDTYSQAFKDLLNGDDELVVGPSEILETDDLNLSLNIAPNLVSTYSTNGFNVFTSNYFQQDTYPETHPVSIAIANYNQWIYRALVGANNTSVKHMHLNSKGLASADAYAKGIGAIGEGIFAQRVTTEYPTSPGGNMYIGYYVNTTHIDALQEHYLPQINGTYYGLKVNYTDINGNPLSKKMQYPDLKHNTTLEKGRIAYEIKTNSANRNSAATLYSTFLIGLNQSIHRSKISGIDAAVLVMDYDAWKKLLNSSYKQIVLDKLEEAYDIVNSNDEQKIYLRIEKTYG